MKNLPYRSLDISALGKKTKHIIANRGSKVKWLALLILIMGLLVSTVLAQSLWESVEPMNVVRDFHTATLISDGKVLVAGGSNEAFEVVDSAEVYDIYEDDWTLTGSLNVGRAQHSATILPDGKVLVVGGVDTLLNTLDSVEIYNPETEMWSMTNPLSVTRRDHSTTLLDNGLVLVVGGLDKDNNVLNSAELYNPTTGLWSNTGSLNILERRYGSTVLLNNGTVLVTGGTKSTDYLASAEIYDPTTGLWTLTGSMNAPRAFHTSTAMLSGNALVTGGDNDLDRLASAEIYDPTTGMWSEIAPMNGERADHQAIALPNGDIAVIGGVSCCEGLATVEVFGAWAEEWFEVEDMSNGRAYLHTATLLPFTELSILIVGGDDVNFLPTNKVEKYTPDLGETGDSTPMGNWVSGVTNAVTGSLRVTSTYMQHNPEFERIVGRDVFLFRQGLAVADKFYPLGASINFRTAEGDEVITVEQMDAVKGFIDAVYVEGSPEFQQAIEAEGEHWPPYDYFVGKTATEARAAIIASIADEYTLNVSVESQGDGVGGTVLVEPDQEVYGSGDEVSLTATPSDGWQFVEWSGDVSDIGDTSADTITFTINENRNIVATFISTHTVALDASHLGDGEGGTATLSPDQETYFYGDEIMLNATSAAGWQFVGWLGTGLSEEESIMPTVDVTVTDDLTITAVFAQEVNLTIEIVGQGSIEVESSGPEYLHGEEIILEAIPDTNWFFSKWGGDISGSSNPRNVVLSGDTSLTATFVDEPPDIKIFLPVVFDK